MRALSSRNPPQRNLSAVIRFIPYAVLIAAFWMPLVLWMFQFGFVRLAFSREDIFGALLKNTFLVASITAILSIIIAYPIALLDWQSPTKFKVLLVLPMMVGLLARNFSWIGLFSAAMLSNVSSVSYLINLVFYSQPGVFVVMIYIFLPIAFFILRHSLNSIRSTALEAARTLGATEGEILRQIVLRQTFRQAFIGFVFVFASALGYFVTPRMIGGGKHDLTGNLVWDFTNKLGDFQAASQSAVLFLLFCCPLYVFGYIYIIQARRKVIGR